jgi:hypothetical protein
MSAIGGKADIYPKLLMRDSARRAANKTKGPSARAEVIQNTMTNSIGATVEGCEMATNQVRFALAPRRFHLRCGTWKPEGPHWRACPPVFP